MIISKLKTLLTLIFINLIYIISIITPKNNNLWVFGSWYGEKYADNSKYLFEYVNKNHPEIRAVWLTRNKNAYDLVKSKGYEVYFHDSFKSIGISIRAGVGVISAGSPDLIPHTTGRMKVAQLWHGTPLKKIIHDDEINEDDKNRLDSLMPFINMATSKDNLYIATSPEVQSKISSAFRVSAEQVKITGYPRNDAFYQKTEEFPLKKTLDEIKESGASIGVYMPTTRMETSTNIFDILIDIFYELDNSLRRINSYLLVKLHYTHLNEVKDSKFDRIIFVDDKDINQDVYALLHHVNYLITDYSSIYFDFLLLDKPIIFFPFDLENYKKSNRKLYYEYENVTPGYKAFNPAELIHAIENALKIPDKYKNERNLLLKEFNTYNDGKNSERVFNEIGDF